MCGQDNGSDHALGHGWAEPALRRIGIDLRTVQARCSLIEAAVAG
jgi:hypothetical protein